MNEDSVNKLIRQLYDAAFDDMAFHDFISDLGKKLLKSPVGFDHNTHILSENPIRSHHDLDISLEPEVLELYSTPETNPAIKAILNAQRDKPFQLHDFVDRETFKTHEGVRFYFEPQRFDKYLCVVAGRGEFGATFLCSFRTIEQSEFDRDEVSAFEKLSPHFAGAMQVRALRLAQERRQNLAERTAAETAMSVVYLNSTGKIIEAEPAAEALLTEGSLLKRRGGYLSVSPNAKGPSNEELLRFVANAKGAELALRLVSGKGLVLRLRAYPVGPDLLNIASAGASVDSVALVIERLPAQRPIDIEAFSLAYSLTPSETRLIGALAMTLSATAAAESLGVSRNTAKTQLSSIFSKTGVENQAALMLLLGKFR